LPVRLETKFVNETRIKQIAIPGVRESNRILKRLYEMHFEVEKRLDQAQKLTKVEIESWLSLTARQIKACAEDLTTLKELKGSDKNLLRQAIKEVKEDFESLSTRAKRSVERLLQRVIDSLEDLYNKVDAVGAPKQSVYAPGYRYLNTLENLEKDLDTLFYQRNITATDLDAKIDQLNQKMDDLEKQVQNPGFRATEGTIQKIKSKASYLKRRFKKAPIGLTAYKKSYRGKRDLKTYNHVLKTRFNSLKERVDKEHVPFMEIGEKLQRFPVRQLQHRVSRAYWYLKAHTGQKGLNYTALMEVKEAIYDHLLSIRERAHRPLEGSQAEIKALKKEYGNLEKQVQRFLKLAQKVKPKDRYQKAALTRLHTHLTEEYLEDLQDLLPGQKPLQAQVFSDFKLRTTSASAKASLQELDNTALFLKRTKAKSQGQALQSLKERLTKAKEKLRVTASNTHLLPRKEFQNLQNKLNGLRSQYRNALKNNKVAKSDPRIKEGWSIIDDLAKEVEKQQVDVFDKKDPFYDDFRKRITFITESETIKELWVRIFPDDIAINNHDARLTAGETQIAQDYYYEVYSKPRAERKAAQLGAWRAAAASLGVRRAAFALRQMRPQELDHGPIPARSNRLKDFWAETSKKLPNSRSVFNKELPKGPEKTTALLQQLPADMQNHLAPNSFTPCAENLPTVKKVAQDLEKVIQYLSNQITNYSKEPKGALFTSWISDLQLALQIINNYYQHNANSLALPYQVPLTFPTRPQKEKSWGKAPVSEVLPERFVVATLRGGQFQQIVTGKVLPQPLPVGIDPTGDQAERWNHMANGDLEVPEELRWMFDFDAAVEAGMGIRVPLQEKDFDKGFDAVMVLGVRDSDAQVGQNNLDQLFKNHLYSDGGLEFLPVNTPTNNTDAVKSAYSGLDNDFDAAFDLFMGPENLNLLPQNGTNEMHITDGQFFKEGLGLPADLVGDIRYFSKKDIAEGRAMNRSLINATLKYFMAIMAKNLFNSNDIAQTVPFMVNHVSAVGTIPSIRVDEQPYGILPITPTDFFNQTSNRKGTLDSYVEMLSYFLRSTKQVFEQMERRPITVNSPKYLADPQAEFLKILGLSPYSKEFYFRAGSNVASRWQTPEDLSFDFDVNWDGSDLASAPTNLADFYKSSLKYGLGIDSKTLRERIIEGSRAYTNRFFEAGFINGALVQDQRLGKEKLVSIPQISNRNYIQWFLDVMENANSEAEEQIFRRLDFKLIPRIEQAGETIPQNTLLFTMLRGALIYDRGSYARRALEQLQHLSVPKLERLLANHFDLVSYRLDAWLSALADYRLKDMRKSNARGTYIGAYGLVENLKPAAARDRVEQVPEGLAPADGRDVYKARENQGFVHGPTLNHAVTAAVLRAGYTSLKSKGNNQNALAVNLSSARVRKALALMEGVSHGQEPGALLGYQLERALHDKYTNSSGQPLEMDVYIYRLRRKFPTYGNRSVEQAADTSVNEQLRPTNVIDGLALIDYLEDKLNNQGHFDEDATLVEMIIEDSGSNPSFRGHPWDLGNAVPNPSNPPTGSSAAQERKKLRALIHEIDNMADAFDALADLTTAEGVYQLVKGNHVRAGAVLKAMAEGTRPVDPEIIKSMREGTSVTHRAILTMGLQEGNPWPDVALTPRAEAEPYVNNWLAQQIGAPETTEWQALYGQTETYLNLADLELQPIDLVLLLASGSEDSMAEIESRSQHHLLKHGATEEDTITLNFNQASSSQKLSLGEQMSLLQNLGNTVAKARVADARDYREEGAEANDGYGALGLDLPRLQQRLQNVLNNYEQLHLSLAPFSSAKTSYTPAEESLALEKLRKLSTWSFTGFYPHANVTGSLEESLSKILSAKSQMAQNITWAQQQLSALTYDSDENHWLQFTNELAGKFYGQGFKILPQLQLDNTTALQQQLQLSVEEGPLRHNSTKGFLDQWLSSAALVRNALVPLETTRLLGQALHQSACSFKPAQLPFSAALPVAEREYWLGAEYPKNYSPKGDRLSLLCFGYENIQSAAVGLVLDEWMELIPAPKQTTGIAFYFNQPDARAPQNILVAVPPRKTGNWEMDDLILTVYEVLRQARLRAVEPEHIDYSMLSQMLPATTALAHGAENLLDEVDLGGFIDYSLVNKKITEEEEEE
jgi:hypothetical protein